MPLEMISELVVVTAAPEPILQERTQREKQAYLAGARRGSTMALELAEGLGLPNRLAVVAAVEMAATLDLVAGLMGCPDT